MKRESVFTFRVNSNERALLRQLANQLQRTRSDTIRWLVREAASQVTKESEGQNGNKRT